MKSYSVYIFTVCFLTLFSLQGQGQTSTDRHANRYLALSQKAQQLSPILLAAQGLAEEDGADFGDFQLVFCGKAVQDIITDPQFNPQLQKAESLGIKIYVCGISLSKFDLEAKDLPSSVEVVDNGILYGFQQKKKGVLTISF